MNLRLGVNVDHVATLRNARGETYPDPLEAARVAIEAGADGITIHLREDRRHIRDADVTAVRAGIDRPLNLEMAATSEMLAIALAARPNACCIVPERRTEVTTEGGLDVAGQFDRIKAACERLVLAGCRVSLFIGADPAQIEASARCGAPCVELHTGAFANAWWAQDARVMSAELLRLEKGLHLARSMGLRTHAGHGLALWGTTGPQPFPSSTASIAALPDVAELHIGHALIGHAVFVGLRQAVSDFQAEAVRARLAAR